MENKGLGCSGFRVRIDERGSAQGQHRHGVKRDCESYLPHAHSSKVETDDGPVRNVLPLQYN